MSLYISTASASSELTDSPIYRAITSFAATVAIKMRHGMIPDGPSLDVTFLLPGQHEKPPFSGMRMGGYTLQGNTLFFERAVSDQMVHSPHAKEFVMAVMHDVIANAETFFQENDVAFDRSRWQELLDKLNSEDSSVLLTH